MKILVADKLAETALAQLRTLVDSVTVNPELNHDTLPGAISDHDILIVRSTKVTRATIEAGTHLSMIIRAGAGVNTIDIETANERGIHVTNCPGRNNDAVAELTMGFLVSADRSLANATMDMRGGKWRKKDYGKARGLKGRTLGIIGFGAIGRSVARRAQAFEMNIIAWDKVLTPQGAEDAGVAYAATLAEIGQQADAVTVHLASTKETKGLINRTLFDSMKNGSIFINTSRGDVVNTADLKQAILAKNLKVGLDVFDNEPSGDTADFNDVDLAKMITCTPHIGASTDQSTEAIAQEVIHIVNTYIKTGKPLNTVNLRAPSEDRCHLVVRHYNRVGVLAKILDALRDESINVEEMENTHFQGDKTASCSLALDKRPQPATVAGLLKDANIIQATLK